MSNLLVRTLTGSVFVAIVLLAFYFGPLTTFILFGLVIVLGLYEFYQFFDKHENISPCKWYGVIGGLFIYILLLYPYLFQQIAVLRTFVIPVVVIVLILELYRKKSSPGANLGVLLLGWLYLITPFYFAVIISLIAGELGSFVLMSVFIIVWMNDTFAYLTGRLLGKHKLFERISPKKTWEGTIGGLVFALLAGIGVAYFLEMDYLFWSIGAVIIAVSAIFGDLFESLLKRSVGVKDSGTILPGHGGILDRFDAVMFALPLFYLWLIVNF